MYQTHMLASPLKNQYFDLIFVLPYGYRPHKTRCLSFFHNVYFKKQV